MVMTTTTRPIEAPVRARPVPLPDRPVAVSVRGSRESQEDRFLILHVHRKNHPVIPEHGWLMAVMDGHGGADAAQAAEELLPHAFQQAFKECRGQYKQIM